MRGLDGAAVRALVDVLPPQVFDDLIESTPELLDGLQASQVYEFIHWHAYSNDYTAKDVALSYGYDDVATMIEEGPYLVMYDDGMLVIE